MQKSKELGHEKSKDKKPNNFTLIASNRVFGLQLPPSLTNVYVSIVLEHDKTFDDSIIQKKCNKIYFINTKL